MKNNNRLLLIFTVLVVTITLSVTTFSHLAQAESQTDITLDSGRLELVTHIGGSAGFVATKDNYAYVNYLYGIRILDITNITAPVSIDYVHLDWVPPINEIVVSGDYAFVTAGGNGLHILSLADPEAPEEIGAYDTPHPGYTTGLVVHGDYLYMADGPRGLIIVDISNPAAPQEIGRFDPDYWMVTDVAYADNLVYATSSRDDIYIVDMSDPTAPESVGLYQPMPDPPYLFFSHVEVAGNYLYASSIGPFFIADISDPANPTTTAVYSMDIRAMTLAGDYLYLVVGENLQVMDISDPGNPTFRGTYPLPAPSNNIDIMGNTAFVSSGQSGVRVFDIGDPDNLVETGAYTQTLTKVEDILGYVNDHIYVQVEGSGTHIFDVSNPQTPTEVGTDSLDQMLVTGNLAFMRAYNPSGIRVMDMSDPVNPNEIGFFPTPFSPDDLAGEGNKIIVASDYELWIIDITNPATPTLLGMYQSGFPPSENSIASIDISGDYVYFIDSPVASYPPGPPDALLYIVNIADPANPVLASTVDTGELGGIISADGRYLYISPGRYCCSRIFDVSDPLNVTEASVVLPLENPPSYYQDWWVMDERGYVYFGGDGLSVWLYKPAWYNFLPLVSR